jgi:hypothetical protein
MAREAALHFGQLNLSGSTRIFGCLAHQCLSSRSTVVPTFGVPSLGVMSVMVLSPHASMVA